MKKNKEIFLYLPRFSLYGGVERFAFNLAIYLLQQNFQLLLSVAGQKSNHLQA